MNHDQLFEMTNLLKEKKQTLALAESCTGGLLSSMITTAPGVSDLFLGAAVTYCDKAKQRLLKVSPEDLDRYGAVSESVARQMALGAKDAFGSDWAVSITGIAGPSGGTPEKPVGTVWFGLAGPNVVKTQMMNFDGERTKVQMKSVDHAVGMLLREMKRELA